MRPLSVPTASAVRSTLDADDQAERRGERDARRQPRQPTPGPRTTSHRASG